jgi:hypothetical protein
MRSQADRLPAAELARSVEAVADPELTCLWRVHGARMGLAEQALIHIRRA